MDRCVARGRPNGGTRTTLGMSAADIADLQAEGVI